MNAWKKIACGLLIGYASVAAPSYAEEPKEPPVAEEKVAAPKVDIVFVLDTTGSMGSLLEGAKRKIWSITNEVLRGKPTPEVRIGLVAYRDLKDDYVTQVTDLTDDLDGVYKKLKEFRAGGGGDGPEHVNQGLKDAIEKVNWSPEKEALRIVFLVGDAPPHEDYGDAFDHKSLAKQAIEKDIIVNAIRCGNNAETGKVWEEIAKRSEGTFVTIDQGGGVTAVATPFDKELAELGTKLDGTVMAFGEREDRLRRKAAKDESAEALSAAPEDAKADRAGAAAKAPGSPGGGRGDDGGDLVGAVEGGKKKLEELKQEELPDEMQKMTPEERKAYLDAKIKEREEIRKKIAELDAKRADYLKKEMEKLGDKDSFDKAVNRAIHEQAEKKGIKFDE